MHRILSERKATTLLISLVLGGCAAVGLTGNWWPGLYLALGIPLALWHFVRGQLYDGIFILILFGAGWVTATFLEGWTVIFPTVIAVAACFTLVRDAFRLDPEDAIEHQQELECEIDERNNP